VSLTDPDGSSVVPLTTGFYDVSPAWSPDGTMLAFRRDVPGVGNKIWVVGIDGAGLHELSDYSGNQFAPSWSPDGDWVAFTSENASGQPLLIARTDGSDVRQVPGAFQFSGQPDWGAEAP
jgi:TolB protein